RDVTNDEVLGLVVLLRRPDLMPLIEDRLHAGRVDARLRRPVAQDPGDVLIGHPPSAEHRVDRLRVLLGGRIRVLIAVVMSPPLTLTDVIGPTGIEVTDVLTQCLSLDLTMDESPAQTHAAGDHGEHDHRGRTRADPRSDHACY